MLLNRRPDATERLVELGEALKAAGYPAKADPAKVDKVTVVIILTILVIYVTMVYGPIAATLVELFPTRIRYTSMSLPYHLGNGWFGGFLPLIATAVAASETTHKAFGENAIYAGLIYPVAVALITLVVGGLFIKETQGHKIDTVIDPADGKVEPFDWYAVLGMLVAGTVALVAAGQGFWMALIGGAGLFALPTIFFRLECSRWRAVGAVLACLALTAGISYFVHPVLVAQGGMFQFFAFTCVLGILTVLLAIAFYAFRPKRQVA